MWISLLAACQPDFSVVVLSEVMPQNTTAGGGLVDGNGESADWVELQNTGERPIAMQGLWLSDVDGALWPFPEDVVVDAGAFVLVFLDADPTVGTELHADLTADGAGALALWDFETELERVTWPDMVADHSWARLDGDWLEDPTPTPLEPNDP